MGFRFVQKSMTLNGKNAYAVTGNQKVICDRRNVRFILVLRTYLSSWRHVPSGRVASPGYATDREECCDVQVGCLVRTTSVYETSLAPSSSRAPVSWVPPAC